MADVNGYGTNGPATLGYVTPLPGVPGNAPILAMGHVTQDYPNPFGARLTPGITYYYQMECTDALNTNTATWLVQGTPDFGASTAAAIAAIAAAALNTPVRQVRITSQWPVP